MINWLLQSTSNHPDLARGVVPAGLLSGAEQARLAALATEKRRRDWLLGRWTAKHLIQRYVERQAGLRPPLDELAIGSYPDGAPYVIVDRRLQIADFGGNLQSTICNLQLTISHSGDRALCAIAAEGQIGADIERVEPRSWQFAEDYFTAAEIGQVRRAPAEQRARLITAIWSAKESALKVLRLGLTVDTRSVSCSIGEPGRAGDWADIAFTFDDHLLEMEDAPALIGWWRQVGDFIMTIAATRSEHGGLGIDDSIDRAVMLNDVAFSQNVRSYTVPHSNAV